jgi:phosphate starvation-inducible PhoH-like protein
MNPYLFTPVLFILSSIGIKGYFPTVYRGFQRRNPMSQFRMPINRELSKTVLDAASRKKRVAELEISDLFCDPSATTPDSKKPASRKIKSFSPKTANQHAYVDLMRNDEVDIVIAAGPAGTGKTMLACYAAVEALKLGNIQKIVITRPVVSVDEEIGFLPGGLTSKMDPWTRPAFDALKESYTQKEIDTMLDEGVIEIVPLGFMRGRTFKRSWIVADEMQNSTPMQMLMLATRIGEGSKMIITGDLNQSDRSGLNGLQEICEKVRFANDSSSVVRTIALESEDVQRSRAAKAVLDIYDARPYINSDTFDGSTFVKLSDVEPIVTLASIHTSDSPVNKNAAIT